MVITVRIDINGHKIAEVFAENVSKEYGVGEQTYNVGYVTDRHEIVRCGTLTHIFDEGPVVLSRKILEYMQEVVTKS